MPGRTISLDTIQVASPCNAAWDDMAGTERMRFCQLCQKTVYNLSAMTREQAVKLIRQKEGKACVRLYKRRDGTVLTSDCPVGLRGAAAHGNMARQRGGLSAGADGLGWSARRHEDRRSTRQASWQSHPERLSTRPARLHHGRYRPAPTAARQSGEMTGCRRSILEPPIQQLAELVAVPVAGQSPR